MRIEQSGSNKYRKVPDEVDQHLIRVVGRFIETGKDAIEGTREEIINEAVRRTKSEILNTMQHYIIEETQTYANGELGQIVRAEIDKVSQQIVDDLSIISEKLVRFRKLHKVVDTATATIMIPTDILAKDDVDATYIFINGLGQSDYTVDVDNKGFITKITFSENLVEGDIVDIMFILVHAEEA